MVHRLVLVFFLVVAICGAPSYGILQTGAAEAQAAIVSDGFESGNFTKLPWVTGGPANWTVSTGSYSGNYAAESPATLNKDELSYLQLSLEAGAGSVITFNYRVSSEAGSDFLQFYLDDAPQVIDPQITDLNMQGWSGEIPWSQASYLIELPGLHTFKWVYKKNSILSTALFDKVWIDDIAITDASTPTYTVNASVTGGHGTITCPPTDVIHGDKTSCTITPEPGYHLETLFDNDKDSWSRLLGSNFILTNVSANHTIVGTFSNVADNIETFETRNLRKLPWRTGVIANGNINTDVPGWSVTLSGNNGGYAAESPATLQAFEKSYLETSVYIPNDGDIVSFWFKVSSDPDGGDFFDFYVDGVPVSYQVWYGELGWGQYNHTIDTAGPHTFRWEYYKNNVAGVGHDRAWVDDITFPVGVVPVFTDATDTETFETGDFFRFPWAHVGDVNWNISALGSGYQSFFAAESGSIGSDQKSSIETRFFVPADGDLTFRYKVSSEISKEVGLGDFLRFYVDGIEQGTGWSGEIDWLPASFPVLAGQHTFKWEYSKDGSVDFGSDKAWIDDVVFPGVVYKPTYDINAYVTGGMGGVGGTVTCPSTAAHGDPLICTIVAAPGYHLASIIDNSKSMSLPTLGEYTIDSILNNHTIAVSFVSDSYVEDFETGNLTKFPWYPVTLWSVNSSNRYAGSYAVQAPLSLIDGGSSTLQTTLSVPADCTMTFMYRVASFAGGSTLKFLIDDAPPPSQSPSEWDIETPWTQASYQIGAGIHSFKWQYSKGFTVGGEVDSAWLDDIIIPGAAIFDLPVMLVNGNNIAFKTTLQDAYDAAVNNDEIRLKAGAFVGGLFSNKNVVVTIKGGYESTFTTTSTKTAIGKTTINAGTVRMNDITVQ